MKTILAPGLIFISIIFAAATAGGVEHLEPTASILSWFVLSMTGFCSVLSGILGAILLKK